MGVCSGLPRGRVRWFTSETHAGLCVAGCVDLLWIGEVDIAW